jgi:hypothetical protein
MTASKRFLLNWKLSTLADLNRTTPDGVVVGEVTAEATVGEVTGEATVGEVIEAATVGEVIAEGIKTIDGREFPCSF